MKLRLFATAAVVAAAAAISAPAFAQEATGSVGVSASNTSIEDFDGQTYGVDGSVAFKASDAWTVSLQGVAATSDGDFGDEGAFGAGAALTYAGSDWRVGPTIAYSDSSDLGIWTVGAVAQKYLGDVTLSGAVTYSDIDDLESDVWSVGGEARYFVSDNFRIQGGLSYASADTPIGDINGWNIGVGGEYQFADTPWSITGGYSHATIDDVDLDADTFSIGLRYSFGGDLKARDRSGSDLGAGGNAVTSALGLL